MTNIHALIVEARFYADLADELAQGAAQALDAAGVTYDRIAVPGAFEIPAAIGYAADTGRYDGFVALGCVIRGETTHYDYVCTESARGLMSLSVDRGLAIGNGILTTENGEQAWRRARISQGNKGKAAAEAMLRMVELQRHFHALDGDDA